MPHDSAERRHGADSRDAERLVALYDAHAAPVWRYVVHLTGDPAGADDIVQETLLRTWRSPRILAQEPESTRSWLFTVARNLVIDEARSARRRAVETGFGASAPDTSGAPAPPDRAPYPQNGRMMSRSCWP